MRAFGFVLLLITASCGGGRVDPGFEGDIVAEPTGATGPNAKPKPRKKTPLAKTVVFERPKLIVIRAAWCGICKEVEPSLMAAYEPYRGKIDLVTLDVTDEASVAKSHSLASDEGVRDFFTQYGARTPTVGVFTAADTGRLVHGQLKDPEVLKRELDHALSLMK